MTDRTAQDWIDHYAARGRLFGRITETQWRILLDLRRRGGPARFTECIIAADAPVTNALRHLNELIDAGWIKRAGHDAASSCELVELTDFAGVQFEAMEQGL